MSIQIDDGDFTRLHNTILEKLAMARFTASEYRCLMFLFRMTYGWQKKEDTISLSQWATGTGIDPQKRQNVLRTLQALVAKGVIYAKPNGNNHPATWGFNKNFDRWDASLFESTVISPDNSSDAPVITDDNTTVISRDNTSVISPDNHQRKKEILKKGREGASTPPARIKSPRQPAAKDFRFKSPHLDPRHFVNGYVPPGAGANPVEVYYERFSINQDTARLNAIKEDDLARLCPDLDKLREVVTAYSRTAFNLGNLQLILDWYKDGIPEKHKPSGTNGVYKNGNLSESEKSKIVTRAKLARSSIRTAEQFGAPIDPQWQQDIELAKGYGL